MFRKATAIVLAAVGFVIFSVLPVSAADKTSGCQCCTKKISNEAQQSIQSEKEVASSKAKAILCNTCYTFNGGKDHCVKCGTWAPSNTFPAILCNKCYTFDGGKDHCVKCGTWAPSNTSPAILCNKCYTFDGGKDHCAKCGTWTP